MSDRGIHTGEPHFETRASTVPVDRMCFHAYAKVKTRGGPGKGNEYRIEGAWPPGTCPAEKLRG